jgi:hypothetical protein
LTGFRANPAGDNIPAWKKATCLYEMSFLSAVPMRYIQISYKCYQQEVGEIVNAFAGDHKYWLTHPLGWGLSRARFIYACIFSETPGKLKGLTQAYFDLVILFFLCFDALKKESRLLILIRNFPKHEGC